MKKFKFLTLTFVFMFLLVGCGKTTKKNLVNNTTWISSIDGSEIIFTDTRIDWYQSPEVHNDNYYSGNYKFYIGKDAVNYITTELKDYGVTKEELDRLFTTDTYNEEEFVVFDLRYDKFILDGEEQEIVNPLVPWYGFLVNDNTQLQVVNMNTASTYTFNKK